MDISINFYELKTQLADLGFQDPLLIDGLWGMVTNDRLLYDLDTMVNNGSNQALFTLSFEKDNSGHYRLYCVDACMDRPWIPNNQVMQYFQPDVPAQEAVQLLQLSLNVVNDHDPFIPLNRKETQEYITILKINTMNTQNLEFLKKSLLNLGFGEKVNSELEKQIEKKTPEFTLNAQHQFNQQKAEYTLHFKAGDTDGMYFFNKYDATIKKGKGKDVEQTFYINKGNGITAKEAFNLMEGRAVHKQLFNKDGEKYQAWLQLDNDNLTQNGSKEIKRFNENYGYDLEQVISGKGIKEMETPGGKESLIKSLKKGNPQQITVERNGEEKKYFIAANPQYKTVDLYDHQMKKIKREELLQPEQKQSNNKQQSKQRKEEQPSKKNQSRKRKMTV